MANIQPEINDFRNAVYGEEVRNSMISLAEKLNTEVEQGTSDIAQHNVDITNAIAQSNTASANANTAAGTANNAASAANTARTNIEANENARQAAETARANAETARQNAEQNRADAETARANAEGARATAEGQRQANEQSRQSAEQTRADAEAERASAEAARRSAESGRVTAEAQRDGHEQVRTANEDTRQAQERVRVNNENERIRAFNNMSQGVIPPATTTTLGGVIVGDGLTVDENGTLETAGGSLADYETIAHAAATYATIASVDAKADEAHVHDASDVTTGTLPVARGGTNATTAADARDNLEAFWTGGDEIVKASTSPTQSIAVKNGTKNVFGADWDGNLFAGTFNYGACATGANVAAKVATLDTGFQLVEGATVYLKCANASSVTGALTLNVNSTGAKAVWAGGKVTAAATSTEPANNVTWSAGAICEFVYSGGAWHYIGNNLNGVHGIIDNGQAIADNAAQIALLKETETYQLANKIVARRVGKVVSVVCSWSTDYATAGSYQIGTVPATMRPPAYVTANIFGGGGVFNGRAIVGSDGTVGCVITQNTSGVEFTLTYLV